MADFEAATARRDALMVKRFGAGGAFVPKVGSRVDGIYVIIEVDVQVPPEFGTHVTTGILATVYKSGLGDIAVGDKLEKGSKVYTVRRPLQDDGQVATFVVTNG